LKNFTRVQMFDQGDYQCKGCKTRSGYQQMSELSSLPTYLAISVDKKVTYPVSLQIERHKSTLDYSFVGSIDDDGAVLRKAGSNELVKYLCSGQQEA